MQRVVCIENTAYLFTPVSKQKLNSFPTGLQPAILKQQPKNDRLLLKRYTGTQAVAVER